VIRSPRRWFRDRLEHDPRRWVVLLVALDGLVAPALTLREQRASASGGLLGATLLLHLAFTVTAPLAAVLGMLVHGRLLWWSGKALRGAARPHEIHAACAWAQLPLVLAGWPLLAELPLRIAAADREAVPGALRAALDLADAAARVLAPAVLVAGLLGAVLYVGFLAEAQRFSAWRALANHVLALVLGIALVAGGIGLGLLAVRQKGVWIGLLGAAALFAAILVVEARLRRRRAVSVPRPGA
jgi:hypothetical protein